MAARALKRATLLLCISSVVLGLLISNKALECEREAAVGPRGDPAAATSDTLTRTTTAFDTAEVVRRFVKVMRQRPVESSCSQSSSNWTHSVSLLATGGLELSPLSPQPHLLTEVVRELPRVDLMVSTLANPWSSSHSTRETLRVLREGGLGVVSLASEAIFSSQEEGVRSTINLLEEAGVHWVGLSAKRDDLVPVNGLRVGFLGFCAVYKECETREGVPYAPVRYSSKTASTAVRSLKSRGADVIVVMVRWGKGGSYFPDETVLTIARYLASLGVTLVIGDHPVLQQSHAYFDDTLIIFSPGTFSRSSSSSSSSRLCWIQGEEGGLEYSDSGHCQSVHPRLRSSLLTSEQHTSFYQIHLSRSLPAVAEYASVSLSNGGTHQLPVLGEQPLSWTRVCGRQDMNCLTCHTI